MKKAGKSRLFYAFIRGILSHMATLEEKRHTLAHLMAAAVAELYPSALPTIGPAIDTGFYYYDKTNMKDAKIAAVLYD